MVNIINTFHSSAPGEYSAPTELADDDFDVGVHRSHCQNAKQVRLALRVADESQTEQHLLPPVSIYI
jgi:hypothetical protein